MTTPDREDIHLLSRHSNLPVASIRSALRDFVYSGKDAWQQFLKILFLSLGAGFMLAGVIFFFAYNWDGLHKFVKLGIIEGLVVLFTLTALLMRNNLLVRNILLTAASVMIGVLFAVFGQVYQTGADAYDLFLNWTLCTILWVIVSGFAPLWLIWIALVNITVQLYLRQTGSDLSEMTGPLLLFLVNAISLAVTLLLKHSGSRTIPHWFIIVLALAAATVATIGVCTGIFGRMSLAFTFLLAAVIISYAGIIFYAFKQQSVFFIAVTGFSIMIILCAGILEIANPTTGSVLLVCIFLGAGTTMLIKSLLTLQKQWSHEKAA
ncbi:DUF2157 domain-containing protein [Pseudoflavitalea rhizosphaerae]|uniref:DUF2157 domain-containing protein n=1 Tax=Pseudoflavitalea rhizosphaerae TaxID=1884793 RepID=UPI000F8C4CAA|nr:DUF2157 domain-containing protein [Pseudoflavitalea rhizosphaerae]